MFYETAVRNVPQATNGVIPNPRVAARESARRALGAESLSILAAQANTIAYPNIDVSPGEKSAYTNTNFEWIITE